MSSHPEFETRSGGELGLETRGLSRVLVGYAIVFNRHSENLGGFREVILPEAIDRTLKDGIDLRALVDHDASRILGRQSAGTLRVEKDGRGLRVEIDPPATTAGQDIVESVRRRDVTGMSFAFRALPEGATWDFQSDPPTRTVTDMLVREVSVVTFPAFPQTDVGLRALAAARAEFARGRPLTVSERLRWSEARR